MPWNGSGTFSRIYSWQADADAGINIIASRMDTDTDDIAENGLNNTICRDGQATPTANLPMGGFRHTGAQNGVGAQDYATLGQVQGGNFRFAVAGGTANAMTASTTPTFSLSASVDGVVLSIRAVGANTSTTPTIATNGGSALTITKAGAIPLVPGDIPGAGYEAQILYVDGTPGTWVLLNPWNPLASVTAGGTADALTATFAPAVSLFDGLEVRVRAANANATTTPTFSPNGLTARTITKWGGGALIAGDIAGAGHELTLRYNLANTRWELLDPTTATGGTFTKTVNMSSAATNEAFATIASASTVNIGAAAANYLQVTGTTTITAFDTVQAGTQRVLEFAGILTLTHNSTSLILPTSANITTAAGDVMFIRSEGAGNWRCASYMRANGRPLAQSPTGTLTAGTVLTMNPFTINTTSTGTHGLGAAPNIAYGYLECLSTDQGYAVGDQISLTEGAQSASSQGITFSVNATNVTISTGAAPPNVTPAAGGAPGALTAAKWKAVLVTYKVN